MRDGLRDPSMIVALAVAFLLIFCLVSALMTAMETAVLSIRDHEREALQQRAKTSQESRALRLLQDDPERALDQVLLVGAIARLTLAVAVLVIVKETPFLGWRTVPSAAGLFALVLLITEVLPHALALNRPRSVFLSAAPLLLVLDRILGGLTASIVDACDAVAKKLTPQSLTPQPSLTGDELDTLVEMQHEEGTLEAEESEVIREILRLSNRTAKDCMTPRTDAAVLPDNLSREDADAAIRSQHHWSIPVYHRQPDSIVGVLDVRAYLNDERESRFYLDHLKPPVFVPESMNAVRLFDAHLNDPFSLVVVLDEYGGFEGVVAAADMLEELIGDAAPSNFADVDVQEVGAGRYLVAGSARLDELSDALDLDLEHDEIDTIGGLLFTRAGEVPKRGAQFHVAEGLFAVIRKSTKTRIEELILERRKTDPGQDGEEGNGKASGEEAAS